MFCKKFFLFVGIVIGCGISAFAANNDNGAKEPVVVQSSINWMTNYASAASQAKRNNKYIFLFFTGSDWCGWCKKFDTEILSTKEFVNAVDAFGVMCRPGSEIDLSKLDSILPGVQGKVHLIQALLLNVSSSELRSRIHKGQGFRYDVQPQVYDFILEHKLYL